MNLFRPAPVRPASVHLAWTLLQTIVMWSVFLWLLPTAIVALERELGMASWAKPTTTAAGIATFLLASGLGLWSGLTMALLGKGTPLPTATARELVIQGPYRNVRNPMALAGIAQGVAVGIWRGSTGVILYSLLGAVAWHWLVRPAEECDLERRFGEAYCRYRGTVEAAIAALEKFAEPKSLSILQGQLSKETDGYLKGRLLRAMAAVAPANKAVTTEIGKLAKNDKNELVRAQACIAAAALEDKTAAHTLVGLGLQDKSAKVRAGTAFAIASRRDKEMSQALEAAAKAETDEATRALLQAAKDAIEKNGKLDAFSAFLAKDIGDG